MLRRQYSHEADTWSAGVILYILLSGVPPFWAQSENGIFEAGAYTRPHFSSKSAVSDTKYTLNTAYYPRRPPTHPLNNP